MIGRTISHYRLTEKLGEGGMGVIYKAIDVRLDRPVAVKFITGILAADADHRRRFVHEAKAASALNHPGIITIYDTGTVDGLDFLAMEYVQGRTLADLIGRKGLPIPYALKYLAQIADALAAAHAAGIVHRDLKPANVIVADNGVVKLLDFGVAKLRPAADDVSQKDTASASVRLTEAGTLVGTVDYMSPEQARGQTVDQRADVWAFGCVLFESLTGRRPFASDSATDTLSKILSAEPDWSALPAATPPPVRQLIRQCLRKDAGQRLRHIEPVLLEPWSEPGQLSRTRRVSLLASLVAAGLILGAAGGWVFGRVRSSEPRAPVSPVRFTTPFAAGNRAIEWNVPAIAVAPDGRTLAYVSQPPGGRPQLYVRRLDNTGQQALPGTEGALAPFFSPDANAIGFFAGGKLKTVTLADGVVHTLCDATGQYGGAWGEDHIIVLTSTGFGTGLRRVPASGGTPEPLTKLEPGELAHRFPSLMPGGRVVVYITSNSTGPGLEEPRVVAQSLETGRREVLDVAATFAMFSPDGQQLLVVRGGVLMAVRFDAAQLKVQGTPAPVIENILQSSTGAAQISVSATTLAYLRGRPETRRLVWVDRKGGVEPLAAEPRLYVHPRLSPDGQRIVVAVTEPKTDIWTYDIERNVSTRLTFEGSNAYPIWTRDGKKVTYVSSRDNRPANVFWKSADGTGPEERLLTSEYTQVTESWAPDGTLLYVELRPPATGWDILTVAPAGTRAPKEFLKTPFLDGTPQISPTGRFVAYSSNESGRQEVQIRSFPDAGGKVTVSDQGGGGQAAWKGDESEIYYRSGGGMMVATVSTKPRLSVGKPSVLFTGDFASIQGKNYDVTQDGKRFLMIRVDDREPPTEVTVVHNWLDDLKQRMTSK